MPRLRPVLAALGVTIAATAVVATAPSPASATPPLPPAATYTVTTGATGPNQYSTDSPASPFVDKDGTFYTQQSAALYGPKDERYWAFFTGTDFDDASRSSAISDAVNPGNPQDKNNDTTWRCNNSPTGKIASIPPQGQWQKNYCDLIGTWVDPDTGDWVGLVHNEFTMFPFGDGMHYDSIDYAVSTDQGRTWDIKDHVITSPYSTVRGDTQAFPNQTYYFGGGDQRLFADPASGYFYVFYGSQVINKPGQAGRWNMRNEHVARAPMSGKLAPGTWQKWYDGAWTEAGIGGKESNIVPVTASNPNGYTPPANDYNPLNAGSIDQQVAAGLMPDQSPLLYMSVTYNAYLGLYLATANPINPNNSANAMPVFATDDLSTQKWYKIGDTGGVRYADYWYHWLVDPVGKASGTITGRTFREYCDFGCPSGRSEWRNITIDSSSPAAPVSPSLAYQITSSSGRTLAQVSGSSATTSVASPTGSARERWSFQPTGDGAYAIVNVDSGLALGVDSATTTSRAWGTKLTVAPADGTAGQQWFIVKNVAPAGSYRLVNRHSGLVLGMSSDAERPAETTPTRSWTNATGNPVGGTRTAAEQTVTLKAVGQGVNLALNKPATAQSIQSPGHAADRAVDSNTKSFWAADGPLPQWWQVDLQGVYQLSNITITNDHRPKRFYQYDVQVSTDGSKWTTVAAKDTTDPATDTGDSYPVSATARYVRVNMTGGSERAGGRIEDVVVNGIPVPNLALNKPATAQSSGTGHAAGLAVDSDTGSFWAADGPLPQWWQVDLKDVYQLSNITVVNPPGGNRSYQYNVQVSTDGTKWSTVATKDTTDPATDTGDLYPLIATARYVRVNMTGASAGADGHLATVVVNGIPAPNLALNKPATAQSSEAGHPAGLAVDSDTGSYWATWPLPGWWQVDLQDVYRLSNITVTNYYLDGRYYKYNVQVSTDGTTWTTVGTKDTTSPATSKGDSYPLAAAARYVRVTITQNSANPSGHITNVVVNGTKA